MHWCRVAKTGKPGPVDSIVGGGCLKNGYRFIVRRGHPNANRLNGQIAEHVFVMAECLGRPLRAGETVHHKNGKRDDNRLRRGHEFGGCPSTCCNLELWSKAQPPGQRVRDKVEYACSILAAYAPGRLRAGASYAWPRSTR